MIRAKRVEPERLAGQIVRRVQKAARKEPWLKTLLQMAWTAGPVTYLALHGGYMLGYGELPPTNLVIYFAAYTLIAGFFAIFVRFFYNVTRGHELDEARQQLSEVTTALPQLILEARNRNLRDLDAGSRAVLSARYILENPDAEDDAIYAAVFDLTQESDLAETARNVAVFRRHGLYVRVEDISAATAESIGRHREGIATHSSVVADAFHQLFFGENRPFLSGRRRTLGFLQRAFAAVERHDASYMTLGDVEESAILTYELLSGRGFPVVTIRHLERYSLGPIAETLDRARNELSRAMRVRNSRLRVLVQELHRCGHLPEVAESLPALTEAGALAASVNEVVDNLCATLFTDDWRRRRAHPYTDRVVRETIRTILPAYRRYQRAAATVANRRKQVMEFERRFRAAIRDSQLDSLPVHGDEGPEDSVRLRIRTVRLPETTALEAGRSIYELFQRFDPLRPAASDSEVKLIAMEAVGVLAGYLPLIQPEVQFAIEETFSAYVAPLRGAILSATRSGVVMVPEDRDAPAGAVFRSLRHVVSLYGVGLNSESAERLAAQFGFDKDALLSITPEPQFEPPWPPDARADYTERMERILRKKPVADRQSIVDSGVSGS